MSRRRVRLDVRGAVQGVGFRPTVYRLATELGLGGLIRNGPAGVELEVEGAPGPVEEFLCRLPAELPPHAQVRHIERRELPLLDEDEFRIESSRGGGMPTTLVLPDLATCTQCLREIRDPADRRYRYAFTTCTLCGPRYSIVLALPYDRANTTMARFSLCAACQAEYEDPRDRRFHAQPVACPDCGPRLGLWDSRGRELASGEAALQGAAGALRQGKIVALKGLGGFQLLVDARSSVRVSELRRRKHREAKPLALMAPNLAWVAEACHLSDQEEALMASSAAPIVLLRPRSRGAAVAPEVAPGVARLGVMLPTTPLHHLLMDELGFPLVATSGNLAEEPLCTDEREAVVRLQGLADLFLVHDRPIARPVDDSVAQLSAGSVQVLRRARGYAPLPLPLPPGLQPPPVLAMGGHMKAAVAFTVGNEVVVSQHLGDLDTIESRENFDRATRSLSGLFRLAPEAVACDLHPDYASTQSARGTGLPRVEVQHHAAHVYSAMLEHGLTGPVLGVAWDGTGYGPDGTVWGGEFLRVEGASWERVAQLRSFQLPGGEAAVRQPCRAALGVLYEILGSLEGAWAPQEQFSPTERRVLSRMLERGLCPRTSSAGRLFDAVASLLNLRHRNAFEGQAAMELEAAAGDLEAPPYPFELAGDTADWEPAVRALGEDVREGRPAELMAARFHETMAAMVVAVARRSGEHQVVLSGGCFQSVRLTERTVDGLRKAGFEVWWHRTLPPNDGGLAAGQALAAALAWKGGKPCVSPSRAACSK